MDLELSDDQFALRDGIAAMLAARVPMERVRDGFDRSLFDDLASAGVFSLRADGFSWADCVVVFEQLGRSCVPGPLVPSLLLGDGRIAGVLNGEWVEHADALDVVVDPARAGLLAPSLLSLEPSPWPLDPCTPIARVLLMPDDVEPASIDWSVWSRAGAVLTAALQLGLADRLTELSVAYAKERKQFDRPIGGFQAIKHLCADMLVRTELARAAVYSAGAHLDSDLDGLDRAIAGAKLLADEAAITNGKSATQVHGGMGFTWEVDVHLYLKRAWVLQTQFVAPVSVIA
jgi:alkylation response protein AidB-like acyl-CoA dehydrogenase